MLTSPATATEVRLVAADARELAGLLVFVREWLTTSVDSELLDASLDRFAPSAGTDTLPALQAALDRFISLLAPSGEVDF